MLRAPLSSSQKNEILRRQAFECIQCQADLEPVGRAPPHFEPVEPSSKDAPSAASFQALCPACHAKPGVNPSRASDAKKPRRGGPGTTRGGTRFIKTGIDTRKF